MANAYSKKKNPDAVRRSILEAVERIAVVEGPAAVTLQAVASAAGVTKGGVTHHFENKHSMIEAMVDDVLRRVNEDFDRFLAIDHEPGRFTRAYVQILLMGKQFGANSPFDALSLMSMFDPALAGSWTDWLDRRLERHKDTDDGTDLQIVRLAADGAWLSYIGKDPDDKLMALGARLIEMTRLP
jgi:AcrR family transcriptional regulator